MIYNRRSMNVDKYIKEFDQELESAVVFLVENFSKIGHNSKPVIFHSIKVAMYLYDLDYEKDLIMAALLHDVIEDTEVSIEEVREKFGEKIASMVNALSFKSNIESKIDQYIEMFERTKEGGRDLLLIKCADIYQNSFFVAKNIEIDDYFLDKMRYFLNISEDVIKEEKPWLDLKERLDYMLEHNVKK